MEDGDSDQTRKLVPNSRSPDSRFGRETGRESPDSRLGRNREWGNSPLPDSAGTGNRGPGTGNRGPAGGTPGISWSATLRVL